MQLSGLVAASRHFAPGLLGKTILIVEDDPLVRDTVVGELQAQGYAVVESESGEEALRLLEEQPVSLLFTDIRLLDRMDGWELAEKARALKPSLPVIYTTGYSAEAPRFVPQSVFLQKPYLPSAVISAIEGLLDEAPARG